MQLEGLDLAEEAPSEQMLALDEALTRLAGEDPQIAELVKLRFFVGLSVEATAQALAISPATAKRWWTFSRALGLRAANGVLIITDRQGADSYAQDFPPPIPFRFNLH